MRRSLGVAEAPLDEGLPALLRLRDALRSDEVVVMQADRAMAGQRSQVVPFLAGHLRLPVGPVKLARLTDSPIVPVFTTRASGGKFRVHLEPPIYVNADAENEALLAVAKSIASFVRKYPEQWLVLSPAFVEDAEGREGLERVEPVAAVAGT
jgi:lauroyl/myristoyl acyltransferase